MTDRTGRVATISEGEGATTLVTYSYMGSGQLVSKFYNQPGIERTLTGGSGSNPYSALDRFGRLIDLRWTNVSNKPVVDLVRFQYGYDRVSNRLFERNTILAGSPPVNPGVDSLFGYDQPNRLTQCETGVLNTGGTAISSPQSAQDWVLDETGNFIEFTQQNLQSGVLTTMLDQTRDHNAVNEITGIDETVGASWATPAHDNSGNMTSIPQPKSLTSNFTATWDAWNRLVSLSDGSNLVAQYEYDPVNRRILVTNYDNSSEPPMVEVRHRYHTTSWQVIEERVDSSEDAVQQFVWNIGYIDDLLLRDRDTNGNGTLDERLYALTDLRYSVMALANTSGTIVERFRYEAHGRSTALNADFATRTESFYDWEYRYTGRELDLPTGLYHFHARYFHADLGRFISRDPIAYADGTSLYRGHFVPSGGDPSGREQIYLNFNAFINGNIRPRWLPEPDPISNDGLWNPSRMWDAEFASNWRGFGEFGKNDETAKLWGLIVIDSEKIGNLQGQVHNGKIDTSLTKRRTRGFFDPSGPWTIETKKPSIWKEKITIKDYFNEPGGTKRTEVSFVGAANYPFVAVSPNIDFGVTFTLTKFCDWEGKGVDVKLKGWHDFFPDYEAYAYPVGSPFTNSFYQYQSPDAGPSIVNLGGGKWMLVEEYERIFLSYV